VIVYRIDRISREVADYLSIRKQMASYGINILSATEPTGSSPTERLIETILAGFAQLDNDVRSERTRNGQLARFKSGLLNTRAPLGYLSKEGYIAKDAHSFAIIKKAWEMMATGTTNLLKVGVFLDNQDIRVSKNGIKYHVRPQTVAQMFRNKFYCGIIVSERYNLEVKGQHEPMISEELFYCVQAILDGRGPNRSESTVKYDRDNPEFPLRRFIKCGICGAPFTGAMSKGKMRKHGYYFCKNRCSKPSSVPVGQMEQRVEIVLKQVNPTADALEAYLEMTRKLYLERSRKTRSGAVEASQQIEQLKDKRQSLIEKNLEGIYPDDIFREQLEIIDRRLADTFLLHKQAELKNYNLEELIVFVKEKLTDIKHTYENSNASQRKALLSSIFPSGMPWIQQGISNPELSLLYQPIPHPEMLHVQSGDAYRI
jgi:site-specific DNA recombinase